MSATSSTTFDSPLPSWLGRSPAAAAAAFLYGMIIRQRNRRYDRHSYQPLKIERPVISIGGLRAGGSGKTPTVMFLCEVLRKIGYTLAVLSRGYKRTSRSPLQLAPGEVENWERTGDEPAMLRSVCPEIWLGIGPDRFRNAKLLQERMAGKPVFLLDDGFQYRTLHRDLDIVCIHESVLTDRLLPQGYLREPPEALRRADLLFLICAQERIDRMKAIGKQLAFSFPHCGQFLLIQKMAGWVNAGSGETLDSCPFNHPVAVCGIARPERFFELLSASGVTPCKKASFPDHYHYTEYDFSSLRELYSQGLITTEKDAVRLRGRSDVPEDRLWYLKVRLQFAENDSLTRFHHYINPVLGGTSNYSTPEKKPDL